MAANIETLLVRMAGVIKKKYNDEELSNYILELNNLFLDFQNSVESSQSSPINRYNFDF